MFHRVSLSLPVIAIVITVLCGAVVGLSAERSVTPSTTQQASMPSGTQASQMDKMDKMAEAMTAMAQMCQTMMQKEDRSMRYAVVGLSIVGALLVIALILFIVLEIQWIRYFAIRIRVEGKKRT